jgi:hypothetical protein
MTAAALLNLSVVPLCLFPQYRLTTNLALSSPPCPADNSKQQQLIEKSNGHENDAKMIAGAHILP